MCLFLRTNSNKARNRFADEQLVKIAYTVATHACTWFKIEILVVAAYLGSQLIASSAEKLNIV